MPRPSFEYSPLPFYAPRVTPDTSRLQQIYANSGAQLTNLALQRGATQAATLDRLAQIISGGYADMREGRARKEALSLRERERKEAADNSAEQARLEREARAAEKAAAKAEHDAERASDSETRAMERKETLLTRTLDRSGGVQPALYKLTEQFPELRARFQVLDGAPVLMNPDMIAAGEAKKRQAGLDVAAAADRTADNVRADKQLAATIANRADTKEKPSIWISKGSDTRFVTPSTAAAMSQEGWRSGNTREQGRPVTSGDAGRIADLDNSLNDLNVLTKTVTNSTGTSAKVGAMLPNWVTELTGRGISAKQKQASIDRVKQVIGKALEGGVLRKEDELKYEKILPTIYDAPEVVTSKLDGLRNALTLKRETTLEALADAGYDTTRFVERGAPAAAGAMVTMIAPDGSEKSVPAAEVEHYKGLGAKVKP